MRRIALPMALLAVVLAMVGAQNAAAAEPTVTGFAPASGPPAWSVTLAGTGFTGATEVTFTPTDPAYAPQPALFTAQDDTTIVASVPFFGTVPLDATIAVATPDSSTIAPGVFLIDGQVAVSEHRGSSGEPIVLTGSGFTASDSGHFRHVADTNRRGFRARQLGQRQVQRPKRHEGGGYRSGSSAGEELLARGRRAPRRRASATTPHPSSSSSRAC